VLCIGLLQLAGCDRTEPLEIVAAEVEAALARGERGAAVERLEAQPPGHNAEQVVQLATLLLRVGEATRARWRIEEGLARFPEDVQLLLAASRVALLLADPRSGEASAARVPETSKQHPESLLLRAQAALVLGHLEQALAFYDEFTERYPDRPEAVLARIATLEREQRHEEALIAVESELEAAADGRAGVEGSRAWLELRRATLLARVDRRDEAVDLLRDWLSTQPERPAAWALLLDLETREGRGGWVENEIIARVAEDPERKSLYPLVVSLHRRAGRIAKADALAVEMLDDAQNVAPFLDLANERVRSGDFDAALALHDQALERFPDAIEPRMQRFDLLLALDRMEAARIEQKSIEAMLADAAPELEYLRARLEIASKQPALARARLDRLIPQFDRAQTQYWLGVALDALGDPEGARIRYGLAAHRDRSWPLPQYALWRHAKAAHQWSSVVAAGRSLLAWQPDAPEVWTSVALALIELGDASSALEVATQARARVSDDESIALAEARALQALGRSDEALAAIERAAVATPEHSARWTAERALLLAQSGREQEALVELGEALELHPDDAQILYVQSSLFYALGRAAEGDRATERLLIVDPDRIDAHYNRCRFRVASGRYAAAVADCRRAAEAMQTRAEPHFVLGIALERSRKEQEAMTAYARALELDPYDVRPAVNLAGLRIAAGDVKGALDVAQAGYRIAPTHPNLLNLLGRLYSRLGKPKRSAHFLTESSRLEPNRSDYAKQAASARQQTSRPDPQASHSSTSRSAAAASLHRTPRIPGEKLSSLQSPNIILFLVDTLRADATTPYGHASKPTPELARWAERGVVFERVRAQSSWTKISMASLLTSLWPRSHGILEADDGLGPEALTLAEVFADAGYATAAVQTNGWLHQSFGFHQGFQHYLFPQGGRGAGLERPSMWPHADRVVAEGIEILERHDPHRPIFLYMHFMDVHEYAAPPEFKRYGTNAKGNYIAATRWVDDAVQRVRQEVERAGLLDNTILVFASDHGETFGEHDIYGHARNVLSPVVDVPLVIRLPFALETPLRISQQARNLDIAPTLLELAGIERPPSFEGASLVPLMTEEEPGPGRVSFARLGIPLFPDASAQAAIHEGRWTYARNEASDPDDSSTWRSRAIDPGREQLFDHAIDPGENVDLAQIESQELERLRAALNAHLGSGEVGVRQRGIRIDPGIAEKLRALGYLK
jgi:arylsulfatase A-like enzyme/Flp pilus assembly protein TadD